MKLQYIYLNPFGGQSNRREDLNGNLHVICSSNGTGKSTVYEAIRHTLFTPVELHKNTSLYSQVLEFFPLPDGNMASCELGFTHEGVSYRLQKTWSEVSSDRSVRLIIDGGNAISGDNPVQKKLSDLLPAAEGTVKYVMMSWQANLHNTLIELTQVEEGVRAVNDLNDVLQAAVLDHGGISQTRFIELVKDNLEGNTQRQIKGLSGRWDFQTQQPEGNNRGIMTPWKVGVGEILKAWYQWETVKSEHEKTARLERAFDDANNAYCEKDEDLRSLKRYLNENREVFNALQKRRALSAKAEAASIKSKDLYRESKDWGNAEFVKENIENEIVDLESTQEKLIEEESKARKIQNLKVLKEKYQRVTTFKDEVSAAQNQLRKLNPITEVVFLEYENVFDILSRAESVAQMGKIKLNFSSYRDQNIKISCDLDAVEDTQLSSDQSIQVEAGARITLEHADWTLIATSDIDNLAELERAAVAAREKLDELSQRYNLRKRDEVSQARLKYANAQNMVQEKESVLNKELGDDSWDDLEQQMQNAGDLTDGRALDVVVGELAKLKGQLEQKRQAVRNADAVITAMVEKHGDQKTLRSALVAAEHDEEAFADELAELPAVPEGIDEDEYERKYTEKECWIEPLQDELQEIRRSLNDIESKLPEESSEEIAQRLESTERAYCKVLDKAKALQRILQAIEQISDQSNSRNAEVKDRLEALVAQITCGEYPQATMDSKFRVIPGSFIRNDDVEIPFNRLSQGTRDAVAVAVRLTMAEHFLKDREGFFILDDPLVNLDPVRQQLVAQLLRDLAQKQQVVVFTCHEGHQRMLV